MTLKQAGRGFAILEIRSPYVIVPLVGQLQTTDDDREASVIKLDASGTLVSISLDNGLSWSDLPAGREQYDLTAQVSGRRAVARRDHTCLDRERRNEDQKHHAGPKRRLQD